MNCGFILSESALMNCMLTTVIAKPMQFTAVSEVPLDSAGALRATSVENKGESAITTIPQKKRKLRKIITEPENKMSGETRQHRHERNREVVAIFFSPKCRESVPPITQAIPPDPMIRKERKGTFSAL